MAEGQAPVSCSTEVKIRKRICSCGKKEETTEEHVLFPYSDHDVSIKLQIKLVSFKTFLTAKNGQSKRFSDKLWKDHFTFKSLLHDR